MDPEIEFSKIIPRGGSQRDAFEEISFSLFAREFHKQGSIIRREGSGGDGGLEGYVADDEGQPVIGLQAKFFPEKFENKQWKQIKESGNTAIRRNRKFASLQTLIFTVPRTLNETEQEKWLKHCEEWNSFAQEEGYEHELEFTFWSGSDLRDRLVDEKNRGLHLHYFGFPNFDARRCQDVTGSNIANLQDRHLPGLHVQTDAEDAIHTFLRTEHFRKRFLEEGKNPLKAILDPPTPIEEWSESAHSLYKEFESEATLIRSHLGSGIKIPDNLGKLSDAIKAAQNKLNLLMDQLREELPPRETQKRNQWDYPASQSSEEQCYEALALMRSEISSFQRFLEDNHSADARCLLLTGRPGEGKTHVLAEVCSRFGEEGGVVLFFEGRIFNSARTPQETIQNGADFTSTSFRNFLATFEAVNPANGLTNLICIDALNETVDRSYWKTQLIPLADEICKFPGIRLIVSCRSDFARQTIPSEISAGSRNCWAAAEHIGLGLSVVEAVPKYFKEYGLKGVQIPPLAREFSTPLFLKIFCETYAGRPPAIDQNTLPTILRAYSQRKAELIGEKIDCDPSQVLGTLEELAEAMFLLGGMMLPTSAARKICESNFGAVEVSRSLLQALLSEGVLGEVPVMQPGPLGKTSMNVRFTYERMWDYFCTLQLLPFQTSPDVNLHQLVCDPQWRMDNPGLLSMLAIRLPQENKTEVVELLPQGQSDFFVDRAWEESLDWRSNESWSSTTSQLFNAHMDGNEDQHFEFLLRFALNPNHPRNANFLHEVLAQLPLAERDRQWTLWANNALVNNRELPGITELLAWADNGDLSLIPDDTVLLIGITLAWFATTTSRKSRKEILDMLLRVLSGRGAVAAALLEKMVEVDEPYVVEATLFACLGCCQQRNAEIGTIAQIAQITYDRFFAHELQPSNILLRHYASEICILAHSKKLMGKNSDATKLLPPWNSPPLRVWSDKSLKAKVAEFQGESRADGRVFSLLDSVEPNTSGHGYGAFGRYVMEGRVERFLNINIDQTPPEKVEHKHRFDAQRAKRFIVQRVFELGWDPKENDLYPTGGNHLSDEEKTERLSKKYQWIALHELIGRLSDHYHFTEWEDVVRVGGSVQDFCQYDIREPFIPDSLRIFEKQNWAFAKPRSPWWLGNFDPLPSPLSLESKRNFITESRTFDPKKLLELELGESHFVTLHGYARWWEPRPVWDDAYSYPQTSISWAFRSYLVKPEKVGSLVEHFSEQEVGPGRLWPDEPEFGEPAHILQFYPQEQADLLERCMLESQYFSERWKSGAVSTTCRFSPDTEGANNLSGSIPSPKLAEMGGLRWSEKGLSFLSTKLGKEVFWHHGKFPKEACVMDKNVLQEWLLENELQIVWRCFGEKLISNDDRDHPGGRAYWMAASMNGTGKIEWHPARTVQYYSDLNKEAPVEWF